MTAIPGQFVWLDHVEIEQAGYRVGDAGDFAQLWTLPLDAYLERDQGQTQIRGGYWRPVYALAVSLDWWLWGGRAWAWHVVNIGWHLLVVVCLYALVRSALAGVADPAKQRSVVFWAVLLFAVHPLNTHSVTWISGRKDLMCAAFSLMALIAVVRVGRDAPRGGTPDGLRMVLAAVALLLALGSKELALVVPAVAMLAPLGGWYYSARIARPRLRRQWVGVVVLWLTAGAYLAYRLAFVGPLRLVDEQHAYSIGQRIRMAATLFFEYVGRVLLPRLPAVSDAWPVAMSPWQIAALIGAMLVIALLLFAIYKKQLIALPLLWFVIWLAPASGLVPLAHVRAERYLYPASWGLILAVVMAIAWWRARLMPTGAMPLLRGVPPVAAAALIALTAYANTLWWTDAGLFTHSLQQDPNHVEAHLALGKLALDKNDFDAAQQHARRALTIADDPAHAVYISPMIAHTNLGLALYHQERFDAAQQQFRKALEARPNNGAAHYHMGLVAQAQQQWPQAKSFFSRALQLNPDDQLARSNLAYTYLALGDPKRCVELYRPLIEAGSTDPVALNNYGSALLALRQYAQAQQPFARLIQLQPNNAVAMAKLAWCLAAQDKRQDATVVLDRARQVAPNHPVVQQVQRILERR